MSILDIWKPVWRVISFEMHTWFPHIANLSNISHLVKRHDPPMQWPQIVRSNTLLLTFEPPMLKPWVNLVFSSSRLYSQILHLALRGSSNPLFIFCTYLLFHCFLASFSQLEYLFSKNKEGAFVSSSPAQCFVHSHNLRRIYFIILKQILLYLLWSST